MNCKKAETYLVEYLYQELSAKKTVAIEKHLHACDHCTKTLESWRAIHRGYQRSAEELQPSPYLKQRLLVMAREQLSRTPSIAERLFLGFKIAALPILIFGILMVFNLQKQKPTEIAQTKKATPAAPAQMVDKESRLARTVESPKRRDAGSTQYNTEGKISKDEMSLTHREQEVAKNLDYLEEEKR